MHLPRQPQSIARVLIIRGKQGGVPVTCVPSSRIFAWSNGGRTAQASLCMDSGSSRQWSSSSYVSSLKMEEGRDGSSGAAHTTSTHEMNLLSGRNKKPRKHRPQYYDVHRPEDSTWWKKPKDRATLRKLLEECMASGRVSNPLRNYIADFPLSGTKWTNQELVLLVGAFIRMGKENQALQVLKEQMEELELDRLNRVMAESARLGNAEVALGALDIALHFDLSPDVITYTSAIHACARGKREDIPTALELFSTMVEEGVQPNHRTYGAVILAYSRLNMWDEVEYLVNSISYDESLRKEDVFSSAIITCRKNFQHPTAARLFRMLLDDGIFPGEKVCNSAMSACARTLDLDSLNAFYRMIQRYSKPSLYTLNTMISAYGNARELDQALAMFDEFDKHHFKPDIVTYNTVLSACMRSRRMDIVPQVLKRMDDDYENAIKWDDITLNILLNGCALAKDSASAEEYWRVATSEKGVFLDRRHFEALMEVYYETQEYTKCLQVWQNSYKCRRRALSLKSLNLMLCSCARLGDDETATKLIAEFQQRGLSLSAVSHNHMIETLLAANKLEEAREYLHKLVQSDGLATTYAFTQVMKHCMAQGDFEAAIQTFELYHTTRCERPKWVNPFLHYPTDAIYILAARAALEAKDHQQVLSVFSSNPTTTSKAVKGELAKCVITSCQNAEDWKSAVSFFDQVTDSLDEDANVQLYEQVVRIVARAGEFEKALDVNGGEWYRNNRLDRGWGFSKKE